MGRALWPAPAPLFSMEGVSKRYGGVRALERPTSRSRRAHPRHSRRKRRRQIDADQDHGGRGRAGRRAHDARRARGDVRLAGGRQSRRHRLHLSGTVADPRPLGRRQYRDQRSADALRAHRPSPSSAKSPRRRWRAPAPRTFIPRRSSRTCRCRAGRWSRSPRRWRADRAFSFSTRRPRR